METKVFYVAVASGTIFHPTIVENFDNFADAESYAALMCRAKKARYIVLEQGNVWDGTPHKNA